MTHPNEMNPVEKPLTAKMEDYLEAIFDLHQDKKVIRVRDIAKRMDVKMPTVTSMLKALKERGFINYEKYEYVELTRNGRNIGREIRRRHEVLIRFLSEILRIDISIADSEACLMEHALSFDTLARLTDFMDFVQNCPRTGENWIQYFEEYRRDGRQPEKCRERSSHFCIDMKRRLDSMLDPDKRTFS